VLGHPECPGRGHLLRLGQGPTFPTLDGVAGGHGDHEDGLAGVHRLRRHSGRPERAGVGAVAAGLAGGSSTAWTGSGAVCVRVASWARWHVGAGVLRCFASAHTGAGRTPRC
jgi:hypothetical protein